MLDFDMHIGEPTMLTTIASIVAGLIGVGIILIGARFLVAPQTAARAGGNRHLRPVEIAT